MKSWSRVYVSALAWACASGFAFAQPPQVSYEGALLRIQCAEVPLGQVFDEISKMTGMELILEDLVKSTRLTADIEPELASLAIERLLEGTGLNYAMFFDPRDWRRVTKIFIGGGGESVAQAAPAAGPANAARRRSVVRRPAPDEDVPPEEESMEETGLPEEEPAPTEEATEILEGQEAATERTESTPNFVPPPPSFPRSSFTPGLESSPFGSTTQRPGGTSSRTPAQGTQETPPAYYPFLDPLGRPIPVPSEMTQQQQQQQQQKPKPKQ